MKQLTVRFVVPLALVAFCTFTKWWHALPVDAPDTMFVGFPLPFACPGWHTSLSWQIFILEFFVDWLVYFFVFFAVVFGVNKYLVKLHPP